MKTSTKKSTERFDKESLFDTSTESSNMTAMNLFQQEQDESLRSQESSKFEEFQEELRFQADSRLKSSSFKMISQQWYKFKMIKMRLKMMKLEAQKLANQKKLTERDVLFQFSISNKFSAFVYWWDKINIFHKYVAFRASKLIFKLKNQNNYNN